VTGPIRVVVADDHRLFREGVVASLRAAQGVEVVGEAGTADEAARLVDQTAPDLALLDVSMPGGGLEAAGRIVVGWPATRVVMLTVSEDEDALVAAMKAGASGYVLKGVSAGELVGIVRDVAAGEVYVAPALAFGLLRELSRPRRPDPIEGLTERERNVLELVAEGLSNDEAGRRLGLAEKTVKHHMTNILAKLHVRSRVEAALLAYTAAGCRTSTGRPARAAS
jgi:DNA-binding NarL/FixJ family response regulator